MAKDTYYFSHDYHSRTDPKILRMIKDGWDNYGLWWAIIEMLHEQKGYLPTDYSNIAYELRTDCERITKVIESYDLFLIKDGRFTSQRVIDNLKYREDKSTKASASANVRWHNANALQTHSEGNAIKGKERKGKNKVFVAPTLEEVVAYKQETLSIVDPQDFIDFYASKGWKVGRESMKDWKASFRRAKNWESNRGKENVTTKHMLK